MKHFIKTLLTFAVIIMLGLLSIFVANNFISTEKVNSNSGDF